MNRTVRRHGWIALLLTGAFFATLPVTAAAAETPVDPTLPQPTLPTDYGCGDASSSWTGISSSYPNGFTFQLGVPQSTVSGQHLQGVVHAWDADGSQEADGSVPASPVFYQSVYVPVTPINGHNYGWYASTYDGTAYSDPTRTCTFTVDSTAPTVQDISDPDFPTSGTPRKAVGQPTTITIRGSETLPSGCTVADTADCRVSGLDHFEYSFGQPPGVGGGNPRLPAGPDGTASLTFTPTTWGTQILYVDAVDVAGNRSRASYSFYVPGQLPPPATPEMSLTAPATSSRAHGLTVTGRLSAGPYDSGEVLHVTRTDLAHPTGTALADVPLSADGTFRITDTPEIGGADTYTVSYPGDPTHTAATRSATVQVSRAATAVSVTTNASKYAYGATATVTAHLGTTYNGRTVSIYAQPYGGTKALVKRGTVDSHGNLAATYRLSRNTVFTAAFAGDYRYAPATATRTAYDYAKVTASQSGYYTSTHYGSTLYRVYHHTVKARFNAAVAPNKAGQCLIFRLQKYYSGAWHTQATSSCHTLSSGSTGHLDLSLTHGVNGRFRMVAGYLHSSKDNTTLSTWGTWQYFTVRT